ncbi:hypothetical protein QOZ80_6BG0492620 [Eleusine coracana subsp. coracana]|nr:hypothetical protein QOZ80_6BG0492620 [Eleusine coracana subsp. coracana]
MFGFLGRNTDASPPPTFRVFCEADEGRCLAVRDGALALAAANRRDKRQHWTKDVHLSRVIKDKDGHPVFSLVNKATGLALQHSLGPRLQVRLARFYPSGYDESVLWTESADLRKAFGCIRTMHNVDLCLDAPGDGTIVMLSFIKMNGPIESQSWKTVPWSNQVSIDELDSQPTSRIYCKHYEGFSVTVRNGIVCLASTDSNDKYQHWIEDKRPGDFFRDHDGYPAFVLVNKVTGEAISGEAGHNHPLKLKPYNPNFLDVSLGSKPG